MGHPSDDRFLVLHGLRLKGFAEPDAVAAAVGLPASTVAEHLVALHDEGLVVRRQGRLTGWSLTAPGRAEQERLAAAELDEAGVHDAVDDGYHRFLGLNGELLATCTAWQVRGDIPNDHADAAYDAVVVERLERIHEEVGPITDDLAAALERYGCFRPRFESAITHVRAGERDYVTKPIIDSYHTVWFELHEDLLTSLGLERSKESA